MSKAIVLLGIVVVVLSLTAWVVVASELIKEGNQTTIVDQP